MEPRWTTDKKPRSWSRQSSKLRDRGIKGRPITGRPLKAMDFFLHELDRWSGGSSTPSPLMAVPVQKTQGLINCLFNRRCKVRLYEEIRKPGLPLDAISEGIVYQIRVRPRNLC